MFNKVNFTRRRGGRRGRSRYTGRLDMRRFEAAARRRQHEEQGVQDDFRLHFCFNELKLKIKII
jgi:hypothetical protein